MSKKRIIISDRSLAMGLDVDCKKSVVAIIDTTNGEIIYEGSIPHLLEAWQQLMGRLPECHIWACYETGGIGFHLCRMLLSLGIDCKVVPVSKIPKTAESRQQKTDRRDALSLAQLYFHAPRTFVRIPTEEEEAHRQLLRTREQMMKNRVRVMQRIKAFLLFHNIEMPTGLKTDWSKKYRQWLKNCPCRFEELNDCLQIYLDELENLESLISMLKEKIVALSQTDRYRAACDRLTRQLCGVGPITAMTFLCEVFRPQDFKTAEAIGCHLGLTPCEYSSGKRHRYGHITHWGPPHLRKLLVEAAWAWVRGDSNAQKRHQMIRAGTKPKTAIVAMARRLAITMWAMTVKEQDYQYRWGV